MMRFQQGVVPGTIVKIFVAIYIIVLLSWALLLSSTR